MGDQPGAGNSRSYKIRGYTRERHSAKPYARPSDHKKGVLETVKDFFSPSWLVDLFKGNQRSETIRIEDDDDAEEHDEVSQGINPSFNPGSNERASSFRPQEASTGSKMGNGQLRSSFGPGYFSSVSRERELSMETPSASRPTRTYGLFTGDDRAGEPSTSSERSEECDNEVEVPSSNNETAVMPSKTVEDEDVRVIQPEVQEMSKSDSVKTSTPALFSTPGLRKRPSTTIFGEPLPEASTSQGSNISRPQLFPSLSESHPQPFTIPKNRPSFSLSAFGSPLPPKPPEVSGFSSSFYHGKTSFGGASSLHSSGYKRQRMNSPTLGEVPKPVRKVVTPKPISTSGRSGVTSQTAKRILDALENMSSPLIDARRIPTPPVPPSASPLSFSPSQRKRAPLPSRAVGSTRSLKAHFPGPPVQDLSAPQQASISRLRAKGTSTPASTATSSGSQFFTASTTIPTFSKPSMSSFIPTPLPISLSPSSSKAGGKVKSARSTSHYTQRDRGDDDKSENEVVNPIPEVENPVPLKLPNGKSLPSFSFKSISQTATKPAATSTPIASNASTLDFAKNNFKFSSPETKLPVFSNTTTANNQSSSNKITFSFSQPVPVSKSSTNNESKSVVDKQGISRVSELKETVKPVEPNNNLLCKFTPLSGSWTCDTCLVSNKVTDMKCVACQSSKPSDGKPNARKPAPSNNDLMQKFAAKEGSWSCDTCMIDNDASKTKCAACETPKLGAKPPGLSSKHVIIIDNDLKKKFALPADSWECDTGMVQNKSTDSTCNACQTPKPGTTKSETVTATAAPSFGISSNIKPDSSLAAKFAPQAGSWTCDICMVDNKNEDSSCAACQTPKPGAKPGVITTRGFNLGSGQTFSSSFSPFNFGMGNSVAASSSSVSAFKVGFDSGVDTKTNGESSTSGSITFGATTDQNRKNDSMPEGATKLPATFRFGASTAQASDPNVTKTSAPSFAFGVSANDQLGKDDSIKPSLSFEVNSSVDKDKPTSEGFTYGANKVTLDASKKGKASSITEAVASGLLKVPEVKDTEVSVQSSKQAGTGLSIADAAKSGFLKVPEVGTNKVDFGAPPNVNLFAPGPAASQPNASSNSSAANSSSLGGFLTAPSGAPSPFSFGATPPSSSAVTPAAASSSAASTSNLLANPSANLSAPGGSSLPPFQFGAASASAPGTNSEAAKTTTVTQSPFSFRTNTAQPVKSTASAPFSFVLNAAPPTNTAAGSFSFGSNLTNTTGTPATGSFQFAPPSTQAPGSLKTTAPTVTTGLFQFGASNTTAVTSSATQPAAAPFGATSAPIASSSDSAKPFSFNSGSTAPGFPFAPAKPSVPTGGSQPSFNFGGSAPKPEVTFPGFGASQPSSSQQTLQLMFGAAASNATPASEETMEADGSSSSGNLFGSTAGTGGTTFGTAGSNGGFPFGAPSGPSSGGFNFGAAQASSVPSTFAFGASGGGGAPTFGANTGPSVAAPAPGGFNFGAATANNNVGGPGAFNFGAGGAPPPGGPLFTTGIAGDPNNIMQRKFRKAVRRTNKR